MTTRRDFLRTGVTLSVGLAGMTIAGSSSAEASTTIYPGKWAPSTTRQLITATVVGGTSGRSTATTGILRFWERDNTDKWRKVFQYSARFGRRGISPTKSEGDGCTPAGVFHLDTLFGTNFVPSPMGFRTITPSSWWVSDPQSVRYDQWYEGTPSGFNAQKGEHLQSVSGSGGFYEHAVHIDSNPFHIPGNGSAIFLHVNHAKPAKRGPTAGCISVDRPAFRSIAQRMAPQYNPMIAIGTWSYLNRL